LSGSILATFATRAIILIGGLASTIITARYLGPGPRGDYFVVATLAAGIAQFGTLGLSASNTYQVASDESLLGPLTANSLWVSLVVGGLGGATTVALFAALHVFGGTPIATLAFAALLAPPTIFFLLGTNLLVGAHRIDLFNWIEVASRFVILAALAAAGAIGLALDGFLAASVLSWWVSSGVLLVMLLRAGNGTLRFSAAALRRGVRYAAKTYAVSILAYLVLRANVFVLRAHAGRVEVGYFSIASQIADALSILPASFALVLFPRLVRDRTATFRTTLRTTGIVVAIMLPAVVLTAAVASPVIAAVFGERFRPAVGMLTWMLPGVIFVGAATILAQHLAAIGLPKALIGVWALVFATLAGLSALLVPRYGGKGAAASLSGAYLVLLALVATLSYLHRDTVPARTAAAAET